MAAKSERQTVFDPENEAKKSPLAVIRPSERILTLCFPLNPKAQERLESLARTLEIGPDLKPRIISLKNEFGPAIAKMFRELRISPKRIFSHNGNQYLHQADPESYRRLLREIESGGLDLMIVIGQDLTPNGIRMLSLIFTTTPR